MDLARISQARMADKTSSRLKPNGTVQEGSSLMSSRMVQNNTAAAPI